MQAPGLLSPNSESRGAGQLCLGPLPSCCSGQGLSIHSAGEAFLEQSHSTTLGAKGRSKKIAIHLSDITGGPAPWSRACREEGGWQVRQGAQDGWVATSGLKGMLSHGHGDPGCERRGCRPVHLRTSGACTLGTGGGSWYPQPL